MYVLIIMMIYGTSGAAVSQHDYSSKERCEAAWTALDVKQGYGGIIGHACVEK